MTQEISWLAPGRKPFAATISKSSSQVDRINIHRQGQSLGQRKRCRRLRQGPAQPGHLVGAQHELVAVKSFRPRQRGGRGAGQDQIFDLGQVLFQRLAQMIGGKFDFVLVAALKREQRDAAAGGIFQQIGRAHV